MPQTYDSASHQAAGNQARGAKRHWTAAVVALLSVAIIVAWASTAIPGISAQAAVPATPTEVEAYDLVGRRIEVRWSTTDTANTNTFKIQWKSGDQQYSASRQDSVGPATSAVPESSTETKTRHKRQIRGLTANTEYTVRVIASNENGDSDPSTEASATPQITYADARAFIEDEVVKRHEKEHPWLRDTFDDLTSRHVAFSFYEQDTSRVDVTCTLGHIVPQDSYQCYAQSVRINQWTDSLVYVVTHELGHTYSLTTNTTEYTAPLGMAYLYIHQLGLHGSACETNELYADLLKLLVHGEASLGNSYWTSCAGTAPKTDEALAVVRSAAAGEIPDWFKNKYQDANGDIDIERFWSDLKAIPAHGERVIPFSHLQDAFGGYCDFGNAAQSAFREGPTTNPWRDGGCVPTEPTGLEATSVGDGKVTLSWSTPANNGGSPLKGYTVRWKSGAQEFHPSRTVRLNDPNRASYDIRQTFSSVQYTAQVTAHNINGEGASAQSTVTTLAAPNSQPSFAATESGLRGVREGVKPGQPLGAPVAASDGDRDTLTYSISGDDAANFSVDRRFGQLRTKAPLDYERKSSYSFSMSVQDGKDHASNASNDIDDAITITITVIDVNEPPVITGPTTSTIEENSTADIATFSATDPEGLTNFRWSLSGKHAHRFRIDDGVLSFWNPMDHENPEGLDGNIYGLVVRVSVGGQTSTRSTSVRVSGADEPPVITGPDRPSLPTQPTQTIATYQATDPEGAAVTWLPITGTDSDSLQLSAGGDLQFRPPYDTPLKERYEATLHASDGALTATLKVIVTNTPETVNHAPSITGDAAISHPENSAEPLHTYQADDPEGETIAWSVSGPDQDDFTISKTGVLSFARSPDYESPTDAGHDNAYQVTVVADDGQSNAGTLRVEVNVVNVNDPPTVSGQENVATAENQIAQRILAFYGAQDPEGQPITGWSLAGADAEQFAISSRGELTFRKAPDYENPADEGKDNEYNISVGASAGRSQGSLSVAVRVQDVNEPPTISGAGAITHGENSAAPLHHYQASDPEGTAVTWSLEGEDESEFTISDAGVLSFASPPDYEDPTDSDEDNVYRVTVVASDDALNSATLSTTVTVIDDTAEQAPPKGKPTISGVPQVGKTLTAETGSITDPNGLTDPAYGYQWTADGADIEGANRVCHNLTANDEAHTIQVRVSFTDDADNQELLTSEATTTIAPRLSGTAAEDEATLWSADMLAVRYTSVSIGATDPSLFSNVGGASCLQALNLWSFTPDQDLRLEFNQPIPDTADLTLQAGELALPFPENSSGQRSFRWTGVEVAWQHGDTIPVRVINDTLIPAPVSNSPPTGLPRITGIPQTDQTLTADTSAIADADGLDNVTFSYQWLRDGAEVDGATRQTYQLTSPDLGKAIRVRVAFTDDAHNDHSLTSAPTAVVTDPAIWSSTITVGHHPDGSGYSMFHRLGKLSTTEFSINGTDYVAWVILHDADTMYLRLSRDAPPNLVLRADNLEFAVADAAVVAGQRSTSSLYQWPRRSLDWSQGDLVSVAITMTSDPNQPQPAQNTPPTGKPAIQGVPQVPITLTADTNTISDADGLTSPEFSYRWTRDGTEVPGQNAQTYSLSAPDQGKTIRVQVTFDDDAGNRETLTSEPTAPVAPPTLTAGFRSQTTSHDGQADFTFELHFSEEFGISYLTLRDHAFTVTGGTVIKAQRLTQGSNIGWRITVTPDSNADVTVLLPATTDCDATGEVCTQDGRMLSNRNEFTVSGPIQ